MTVDPSRYPLLDSEETLSNAVAQIALPLAEMISEGEKDDNNDDASVTRREDDLSCLVAAVTNA